MKSVIHTIQLTIFVLTFNRDQMLEQALQSIMAQTRQNFRVIVLDNGSTDRTPEVVEKYKQFGVEYWNSQQGNQGQLWNYSRAIENAGSEWTMLFHDDDWMHPNYIEYAMGAIEDSQDVVLCCSITEIAERLPVLWPRYSTSFTKGTDRDLAALLYRGWPIAFCSCIYRTSVMRKTPIFYELYGKIFDRPWMLGIAKQGQVIVFNIPMVLTRQHGGQDSRSMSNHPLVTQIAAMHRNYRTILGDQIFNYYGRIFLKHNLFQVMDSFRWCGKEPFLIFCFTIWKQKGLTVLSIFGGIPYLIKRLVRRFIGRR